MSEAGPPWFGLQTREAFLARYQAAAGQEGCLVLVDLDHTKRVNDYFGLRAGDAVLAGVAAVIASLGLPAGRVAGDEFAVWGAVDGETLRRAVHAVRVPRAVAEAVTHEDLVEELLAYRPTACVAIARGMAGEALWRRADDAMRQAKIQGRDRCLDYS